MKRATRSPEELKALETATASADCLQRLVRPFWASWVQTPKMSEFTLHSPWWCSGHIPHPDGTRFNLCAAVMAKNEGDAKNKILSAFDAKPTDIEWRFCEQKPDNWIPFCDRFPRAPWMRWPNSEVSDGR